MSARAAMCALCDHVIDASRLAAATRAADRRPSRAGRSSGALRTIARRGAIVAGTLALVGAAATVALAVVLARQSNGIAARRATEQATTVARLHVAWPALDAAATHAARDVRGAGDADRQALRELLAAVAPPASSAVQPGWLAAMDADTSAWTRYGHPRLVAMAAGDRPGQVVRLALPARLPDSLRTQLAADTLSPWLAVLRRAAASPLPPAAWSQRPGAPAVAGPVAAPQFGYGAFKAIMWGNGAAALLALDRGDRATAVRRARENVAAAQLVARTPQVMAWLIGRHQLASSGALLAHVGRVADDSAAVADGEAITRAARSMQDLRMVFGPTPGARDPGAAAIVAMAGDTLLPPALRVESALQIVTGSCLNARETLLGANDARQAPLDAAVARLADLDPEQRLRPMVARALVEWRDATDGGAATVGQRNAWPRWAAALSHVGLDGVAGRTVGCTLL